VVETPLHLAGMHLQHLPPGVGASTLLSLHFGGTTASKPLRVTPRPPPPGHPRPPLLLRCDQRWLV
jgi:hypothetical protein